MVCAMQGRCVRTVALVAGTVVRITQGTGTEQCVQGMPRCWDESNCWSNSHTEEQHTHSCTHTEACTTYIYPIVVVGLTLMSAHLFQSIVHCHCVHDILVLSQKACVLSFVQQRSSSNSRQDRSSFLQTVFVELIC